MKKLVYLFKPKSKWLDFNGLLKVKVNKKIIGKG